MKAPNNKNVTLMMNHYVKLNLQEIYMFYDLLPLEENMFSPRIWLLTLWKGNRYKTLSLKSWKDLFCFYALWASNSFHIRSPEGECSTKYKAFFFHSPSHLLLIGLRFGHLPLSNKKKVTKITGKWLIMPTMGKLFPRVCTSEGKMKSQI